MKAQDQYAQIEAYISGKMTGKEKEAFEIAMKGDKNLEREVSVQRDMHNAMAQSPKDGLRDSLAQINAELPNEKRINRNNRFFLIAFVFGIAFSFLLIKYYFTATQETPATIETQNEEVIEEVPEEIKPTETLPEETPKKDIEETPSEEPPKKEKPAPVQKEKPKVYAANFEPNPILDNMIERQVRKETFSFKMERLNSNRAITLQNSLASFHFSGSLENPENVNPLPLFTFYLFSNKEVDYEEFMPLETRELSIENLQFDFSFSKEVEPGLYYYLIEDSDSGKIYKVGKVRVEE